MTSQILILIAEVLLIGCLGWACGLAVNYCADLLIQPGERLQAYSSTGTARRRIVVGNFILVALWTWFSRSTLLGFTVDLILLIYFGIVWVIDQETRLIPNLLSACGLVICLIAGIYWNGFFVTLVGGLVGFSLMLCLFGFGFVFIAASNRWRQKKYPDVAFGFGDVLLGGTIGLAVGWPLIMTSLLIAILVAGAISLLYLGVRLVTQRYSFGMAIPYAPFLIIGAIYALFIFPITTW